MANPPHLFRVDRRLDELVLHIRPWSDDVVDKLGFDPRSPYVKGLLAGDLQPVHGMGVLSCSRRASRDGEDRNTVASGLPRWTR